jgi:hypothetical protein
MRYTRPLLTRAVRRKIVSATPPAGAQPQPRQVTTNDIARVTRLDRRNGANRP